MRPELELTIRITSATIRLICGFMLLNKVPETQSLLFAISGFLLMFAGLHCIVPWMFDKIELYLMNRNDPDCTKEPEDAIYDKFNTQIKQ